MLKRLIPGLLIVVATLAVYGQVSSFEFVGMDDRALVVNNRHVSDGLSLDGVRWALSSSHVSSWMPLTWVSHMLDCEIHGLDAGGHHVSNLLLHVLAALLLFGLLDSATGRTGRSALVAALFALHPLHVESVAWVAERKDVLSACFGWLSLWAYVAYARRPGPARAALVCALLGLGLLAKPMLVSWPFVFLLFDLWPLGRWRPGEPSGVGLRRLLLEKLPFLALSAGVSAITLVAQRAGGATQSLEAIPFLLRVQNALVSYVVYLRKALWPADLSNLYPHPNLPGGTPWEAWQVLGAAAILLAIGACVVLAARRRYLLVGWLFYLGTLVPVIGLVQVGGQAMADRYTYLPLTGIFWMLVWGGADAVEALARRERRIAPTATGAALALLLALAAASWAQTRHWSDARSLYQHSLRASPTSRMLHVSLGVALVRGGEIDRGLEHYRKALRIDPDFYAAHYNLATGLVRKRRFADAAHHYGKALALRPDDERLHLYRANALMLSDRPALAVPHYRAVLEARPDDPQIAGVLAAAEEAARGKAAQRAEGERRPEPERER
jgi:tetratricopeptide (TPR) repeat protein